jgi:hypothetical protein
MSNEEEETPLESEQETEEKEEHPLKPERPQIVHIQTPLDRPEMDFFINQFMNRLGLKDRTQAAVLLTNIFEDMGLDPYADLKELQDAMKQVNSILQNMPDTPQARQVKDTIGAMYSAKAGRTMLDHMPQGGSDPMADRFEKMMDKYMPYIIFMSGMGKMMVAGSEPQHPQQQESSQNNHREKAELPEEFKNDMAALKEQVAATQALLREQAEDKKQKDFAEGIIASVHSNINPQIDALRGQVESLAATLQAKANEPQAQVPAPQSLEMKEISQSLKDLGDKLSVKAEQKSLSLGDLDTVMGTLETLEKRLKKDVPAGEFDWKSTTINTLGEIGREAIIAFKDMQTGRQPPAYGPPGPQQQTPGMSAAERQEIVNRQMKNYILQKINQGAQTLDLQDAAKTLGASFNEVNIAYQILVKEGWIKQPQGQGPPPGQPTQTQAPPQQVQPPPGGEQPVESTGQPFTER